MTQTTSQLRIIDGLGIEAQSVTSSAAPLQLDPRTYDRALDCVHCGLCLPACPTYTQNGMEADSPRGRIHLMKGLADGRIEPSDTVVKHLDLCLDCRACETACPSGVVYHELIEEARNLLAAKRTPGLVDRLIGAMFFKVFPYPTRLKLAILPARILQKLGLWRLVTCPALTRLLPPQLEKMQQMLPRHRAPLWERALQSRYPAAKEACTNGKPQAVVGLFAGCVGSVLYQHINRQTIDLLTHFGCEVIVSPAQKCCGAIDHHGGNLQRAQQLAKANIDAYLSHDGRPTVDAIVNTIAGCGAMLKDYAHLLRDDADYAQRAKTFVEHTCDISELIVKLDPERPPHSVDRHVTYHDACHLAHAQNVTDAPRRLLGWIKGLRVTPLTDSDMCCGAAGTYNLSQPQMARQLAERKIEHIGKTGADICVMGNVGCAMQIQSEADRMDKSKKKLQVMHPVTLLHEAYFNDE